MYNEKEFFKNYYGTHAVYAYIDYNDAYKYFDKNFGKYFKEKGKESSILEIGCGKGKLAHYLEKNGFKNYIGIDLDPNIVEENKSKFKNYKFECANGIDFLKDKENEFDIIFMDQVFEHLTLDEEFELTKLIKKALKDGGMWINVMPNAQSLYYSCNGRFTDITHKIIHNPQSFNQILLSCGFKLENIRHKNLFIGYTFIRRLFHKVGLLIHKFLLISMGVALKIPYTTSFISIIKKDEKKDEK